jgi:hypothetical protein
MWFVFKICLHIVRKLTSCLLDLFSVRHSVRSGYLFIYLFRYLFFAFFISVYVLLGMLSFPFDFVIVKRPVICFIRSFCYVI